MFRSMHVSREGEVVVTSLICDRSLSRGNKQLDTSQRVIVQILMVHYWCTSVCFLTMLTKIETFLTHLEAYNVRPGR
jgi:hypothetical protein